MVPRSHVRQILPILLACVAALAPRCPASAVAADDLARSFLNPPPSTRPWVYWFFMDGNMSREGITADLEAMARAGIGGVIMMEVNVGVPRGPVEFMSAEWRAHFKHAVAEAERLGLQLTLNAGPGWTGSGGPWIKPEQSMQHLVASETRIVGPTNFSAILPQPPPRPPYFPNSVLPEPLQAAKQEFYRDVCVLAFPTPVATNRIEDIDEKALYLRHPYSSRPGTKPFLPSPATYPKLPADAIIATNSLIDISARLDVRGHLEWDVPPGDWTILRFGRTSTGANTRPAPAPGLGLECDKFSAAALDAHFDSFVGTLLREVGPRKQSPEAGWNMLHIDSWEMGAQNWSKAFREEFRRRRGYDPTPYLPAMTGRIIDAAETSERFLWDLRQTAQELVIENHAKHLRALGARHGFGLSIEPYDMNPCSDMGLGAIADVPMCEFWLYGFSTFSSVIEASSIAHTCGRPVVAAEAFTSSSAERWQAHPAAMKELGDWALCAGVNRIVFHRYQHQPWLNRRPGMTMGPYGVHWERTQTWWDMVPAYHLYLSRCQFLLRRGLPVADILFLVAEGAPQVFRPPNSATRGSPPDRLGHNFDGCAPETFLARVSVSDGMLVLPDGMTYRALVLPDRTTMTPALFRKVRQVVQDGATVIGPRPQKSPSLGGYPQCDEDVRRLADEVWGDCDGTTVKEHAFGKGRVIWERAPQANADGALDTPLADAKWIWRQEPESFLRAAVGEYLFQRSVSIGGNAPVEWARIYMTADNAFALSINGKSVGGGSSFHQIGQFDVASFLVPGSNTIEVIAENGGDAPNPAGLIGALVVRFRDGRTLRVPTDRQWRTSAGSDEKAWQPSAELGPVGMAPWKSDGKPPPPEPEQYGDFATVTRALGQMNLPPDFESDGPLRYTHRRDGGTHIYFVANREARRTEASCSFRVSGRFPELWDPMTGHRRALPEFRVEGMRTTLPLLFEPFQSFFVVFADEKTATAQGENYVRLAPVAEVPGPWEVSFDPQWGGPDRPVAFDKLHDWTQRPEDGIRFYSGTAKYKTTLTLPDHGKTGTGKRKMYLDLGTVCHLARIRLNGRDLGVLWCPPWRVDISDATRLGANQLEIDVVNLWPNRLIGDEQFPDDCTEAGSWQAGCLPTWPNWLLKGQPRTETRRMTFTTFKHWRKDDAPLPSGLLGPVIILSER